MSERFSKLFTLPENLYCPGAPVMIAAGAIQKDNETGRDMRPQKSSGRSTGRRAMLCPPGRLPRGKTGTSSCGSADRPEKGGISAKPLPDNAHPG